MTPRTVMICVVAGLLAGCSSVAVVKNPGDSDKGIRYWRPKPYLLVTPADATGRMVKIKLEYLPDYSEEYSIKPKGAKPPEVQLKDGWNLVAVGGPAPPPEPADDADAPPPAGADPSRLPEYVVAATNVPIGYYESVFDASGPQKQLKGWRYIGLSPMGGGAPIGGSSTCHHPNGAHPPGCPSAKTSSISGPLYGMVFFNGAMTFRQLDEIANNMTCPQYVKLIPDKPAPPPVSTEINVEHPQGSGTEMRIEQQNGASVEMRLEEAAPSPPAPPPADSEMFVEPELKPEPEIEPELKSEDSASLNLLPAIDVVGDDAVTQLANENDSPLDLLVPPATEDGDVAKAAATSKIPPPKVWATPGTGL